MVSWLYLVTEVVFMPATNLVFGYGNFSLQRIWVEFQTGSKRCAMTWASIAYTVQQFFGNKCSMSLTSILLKTWCISLKPNRFHIKKTLKVNIFFSKHALSCLVVSSIKTRQIWNVISDEKFFRQIFEKKLRFRQIFESVEISVVLITEMISLYDICCLKDVWIRIFFGRYFPIFDMNTEQSCLCQKENTVCAEHHFLRFSDVFRR